MNDSDIVEDMTVTPQETAAMQAVCTCLSDVQLHALMYVAAHMVAHRQGVYTHQMFEIEVNVPEEPVEKKTLLVLPGGKDA